jgi:hypothetical protein
MWFMILVMSIKSSDRERQMTDRLCGRPHLDFDVVPEWTVSISVCEAVG